MRLADASQFTGRGALDGDASLFTLVDLIEKLSSARTVEEVAAVVRSSARQISGADGVTFVLRDDDKCFYMDEDAIGPLWKGRRFPLTSCISGWAMMNRRVAIVPDIYVDSRIPHDAYRPTFVKSLVMTPVRPADPIAAIGAYWAEVRQPTEIELARLEVIARASATALANVGLVNSLSDALARKDALVAELDHRAKNTLAAVQAIAAQTLRTAASPEAFNDAFSARLMSLSRAHEMLVREGWRGAPLKEVLQQAVSPYAAPEAALVIDGPDIHLAAETSISFLMTFHELASNAARYGALSRPAGRVTVGWRVQEGDPATLRLLWRETGGPDVTEPDQRGFGVRLIERGVARDTGGEGRLEFLPGGVEFHLSVPLSNRISRP